MIFFQKWLSNERKYGIHCWGPNSLSDVNYKSVWKEAMQVSCRNDLVQCNYYRITQCLSKKRRGGDRKGAHQLWGILFGEMNACGKAGRRQLEKYQVQSCYREYFSSAWLCQAWIWPIKSVKAYRQKQGYHKSRMNEFLPRGADHPWSWELALIPAHEPSQSSKELFNLWHEHQVAMRHGANPSQVTVK